MNNKEKQLQSENEFMKYLNFHSTPFWYVQQDLGTFSIALKKCNVQRPDFFVFIAHLGFVVIDVEYKVPLEKYNKLCVCAIETEKYMNLQRLFGMQVWFAFSNEKVHYTTWYFISATRVTDLKKRFLVKNKGYVSVPISEFVQVASSEKFTKIFR
jgi:hypothetical protein